MYSHKIFREFFAERYREFCTPDVREKEEKVPNMRKVCILAEDVSAVDTCTVRLLQKSGFEVSEIPGNRALPQEDVYDFIKDADAVIAGAEQYSADLLKKLPKLKVIARRGVGFDNVDLAAAEQCGIRVTRTVGAVEEAAAELTMAFVLNFARLLPQQDAAMKQGKWQRMLAMGLSGKTIGLIGFGGIGQEVARRAGAFGMRVLYYSRRRRMTEEKMLGAEYVELEQLLQESDFVSLHCPLTEQTFHLIGEEELEKMKASSVLINTARGPVCDETVLAKALQQGKIRGAAVDVFPCEPETDSPLLACENVMLTPHIATFTRDAFVKMNNMAAQSIIDWLDIE